MSERTHTSTPELNRQGDDQQAAWLELARRQASTAAEIRIQAVEPFDWEDAERKSTGGWLRGLLWGPAAPARLRLSWALPALAVVVLGGATGTLAYVHLKEDGSRAAGNGTRLLDEGVEAAGPGKARGKKKNMLDQYLLPPTPAPQKEPESVKGPVRKSPTRKRAARKRAILASKKAKAAAVAKPAAKPATEPNSDIIFGNTDMPGGGEVIIVRPPSKLGPLFRTKDFKKGGPYGSRK